jgi:ArsR family transcriptional regulator, arsenate/arsenite/antimonite-responsive transcriptional repressor / arsenate reductase (thioredoxin)
MDQNNLVNQAFLIYHSNVGNATAYSDKSSLIFLQLAAHPLRWRLLSELARSDRHVDELTRLLGRPQNLVSYHLGRLRDGQLIRTRKSSADPQDTYYSADLARCRELLARAGTALHLGMGSPDEWDSYPALPRVRILFLCTGNSTRSQIAEAFVEQVASQAEAVSAGSHPRTLHPNTIRVMHEHGIDISSRTTKHMSEFVGQNFDYVISLCDRVREVCPEFPGNPEFTHWSIPDPALEGDTEEETYQAFQRVAAEIKTRVRFLLHIIEDVPPR